MGMARGSFRGKKSVSHRGENRAETGQIRHGGGGIANPGEAPVDLEGPPPCSSWVLIALNNGWSIERKCPEHPLARKFPSPLTELIGCDQKLGESSLDLRHRDGLGGSSA